MPYVDCHGVNVYFRTSGSNGAMGDASVPLLLAHGFMQESKDWFRASYVDQLASVRPLVLVDFRGHGHSDKPHSAEDYSMPRLVADLVAVLDHLSVDRADFMGYSFGAWVGFGLAKFAPERVRSLVLGGMHPYVRDPAPLNRRIDRFTRTREALAEGGHHADLIPDSVRDQFAGNDIEALISLTTAIRDSDSLEDGLDSLEAPVLIYCGDKDPSHSLAMKCVTGRPNLTFLSLPGLGHMEVWEDSSLVLPHVIRFLNRVEEPSVSPE